MTEETAKKEVKLVQVTVDQSLSTVTLNGTKVEISPEGNVVVFTNDSVQTKPAATATAAAATEDKQFSIGKDFNTVAMYGAKVELAADGSLIVYTNGTVRVKPAPANDTAIKAAEEALEIGATMADGSVFAGLTADGKQKIYAIPNDLSFCMRFNDAAKGVTDLNNKKALGHGDWQIPSQEDLRVLQKNQNAGELKGTFNASGNKASGSDFPYWYWSSTEDRVDPSLVWGVRFSDGFGGWYLKDFGRLSCRPVRLVDAKQTASHAVSVPAPG